MASSLEEKPSLPSDATDVHRQNAGNLQVQTGVTYNGMRSDGLYHWQTGDIGSRKLAMDQRREFLLETVSTLPEGKGFAVHRLLIKCSLP